MIVFERIVLDNKWLYPYRILLKYQEDRGTFHLVDIWHTQLQCVPACIRI